MIKFIHVWNEICANKMKGRFMKPRNPRTLILTKEISPLQSCESLLRMLGFVYIKLPVLILYLLHLHIVSYFKSMQSLQRLFYSTQSCLINSKFKKCIRFKLHIFCKRHASANQSILMSVYVSVKLFQSLRFIWSSVFLIYLIDFSIFDTWVDHLCQ